MRVVLGNRIGALRLAPGAIHRQQCNLFSSKLQHIARPRLPHGSLLCMESAVEGNSETYPGMYGSWSITQQDLVEVRSHLPEKIFFTLELPF